MWNVFDVIHNILTRDIYTISRYNDKEFFKLWAITKLYNIIKLYKLYYLVLTTARRLKKFCRKKIFSILLEDQLIVSLVKVLHHIKWFLLANDVWSFIDSCSCFWDYGPIRKHVFCDFKQFSFSVCIVAFSFFRYLTYFLTHYAYM
jgi:hypothetical protein